MEKRIPKLVNYASLRLHNQLKNCAKRHIIVGNKNEEGAKN